MQHLIHFALRSRLLMVVLGVLVLAGGYDSYRHLPVDAFPDVTPALVQVFTETEGLAPEEVETYVTYPVEVAMNGLPHLKELRSVSNFGLSVVNIYFEDGTDIYTVQCNVRGRDIGSFVEEAQGAIEAQVPLPPGYLVSWGGQFQLQQEANKRLALVIPITLLIVFLLLYSTFTSLKNTLLILLNIPLALVGGIAALWVSSQNLSVPASVGCVALFGIALENGMVLVTSLNQLVRDGMPLPEASVRGACLRLRPVLMTALTTTLGLLPLLFAQGTGSEVQRPLATVVLGGLVTSTVLTLLVLPALYKWFAIVPVDSGPPFASKPAAAGEPGVYPTPQALRCDLGSPPGARSERHERG